MPKTVDVRGQVTPVAQALSLRGALKWFGCIRNSKMFNETSTFTNATYGAGMKIEAEAPFSAVRLYWISRAANAMTGSKAIVGVTESSDTTVAAQAFHPRIDGVTYNTVVSGAQVNGWRAVTWASNPTVDHAAGLTAPVIQVSDWIQLSSVPRADGGERPLFLLRAEHDGATGGAFATYSEGATSAVRTPIAAARNRIMQLFIGTNLVSTPSAVNGALNTAMFEIIPEFRYNVPALNVCGVGDSTLACDGLGLTAQAFTAWGNRACMEVSTPERPVHWVNMGCSGRPFADFWLRFQELFTAGYRPDVLVVMPLSVNDYTGDVANMGFYIERGKMRAQEVLEFAQTNKVRNVVFVPLLPYNSLSATDSKKRLDYNTWLAEFAKTTGSAYLDISKVGDGGTPERWLPSLNYAADGIHENELGVENVFTPALVKVLNDIV